MSAMAAKRSEEIVGQDQDGRTVYADKCVVLPGSLRKDGTRRKDVRVRTELRPDGSWRSFVPQNEVKKYEVRARRSAAGPPGAGPPLPPPLFKRELPAANRSARRAAARRRGRGASFDGGAPLAPVAEAAEAPASEDAAAELRKRAKGLRKKLAAASDLQARVDAGLEPSTEQAEKLARRGDRESELEALMEALAVGEPREG